MPMPNTLCAKSLNPDASGSVCDGVSELSNATGDLPYHLGICTQVLKKRCVEPPHCRWTATKGRPPRPFGRPTRVCLPVRVRSILTRVHCWPSPSFESAELQGR
jgi:hypothetical protein